MMIRGLLNHEGLRGKYKVFREQPFVVLFHSFLAEVNFQPTEVLILK